jgi:hypothetical protein
MAIRDRYIIKFRDAAQADLSIEATRQGGSVVYDPPRPPDRNGPGTDFYRFEELNSAIPPKPIRVFEVHKDAILAIINQPAPVDSKGKKK